MSQSSLLAWLNKPKAVVEAPIHSQHDILEPRQDPLNLPKPSAKADDCPTTGIETASKTARPFLRENVELRSCTKDDIPHLKRLTGLLLPIPYPESFYREIIGDPLVNNITLVAVWHDDPSMKGSQRGRLVGAIRCRLLAHPLTQRGKVHEGDAPMLYLSTLAVLSPYRGHGIATHLLQSIVKRSINEYGVTSVGAHVWEANAEGLEWYRKRGFHEVGRESGYYRRLNPQGAVVMQRATSVTDLMDGH